MNRKNQDFEKKKKKHVKINEKKKIMQKKKFNNVILKRIIDISDVFKMPFKLTCKHFLFKSLQTDSDSCAPARLNHTICRQASALI